MLDDSRAEVNRDMDHKALRGGLPHSIKRRLFAQGPYRKSSVLVRAVIVRRRRLLVRCRWVGPVLQDLKLSLHPRLIVAGDQAGHLQPCGFREPDHQLTALTWCKLNRGACFVSVGIMRVPFVHFIGMACNFAVCAQNQFVRDLTIIKNL